MKTVVQPKVWRPGGKQIAQKTQEEQDQKLARVHLTA